MNIKYIGDTEGGCGIIMPFTLSYKIGDTPEVCMEIAQSLKKEAEELIKKYPDPICMFSGEAVLEIKRIFESYIKKQGYEPCDESGSPFSLYILDGNYKKHILSNTRRIYDNEDLSELLDYDVAYMCELGYIFFGTYVDGRVVSVAHTDAPFEDCGGAVEIGVETVVCYEGRGYGKSSVAALAGYLNSHGTAALYECEEKNISSVKLCEGLGGRLTEKRLYIVGV